MQDLPDKSFLLAALARFLDQDLRPHVADPALAFRVRIASSLAQLVSRELGAEELHLDAELERLSALGAVEASAAGSLAEKRGAITRGTASLISQVRSGELDPERRTRIWEHAKQTLAEKLAVAQPRFDLSR